MKPEQKLKINTINHLARRLGCSKNEIENLAMTVDKKYKSWSVVDEKGKKRDFDAPQDRLKIIQSSVNRLLQRIDLPHEVYSYAKHKDSLGNARHHLNSKWILKLDIKDFFPSISYKRVKNLFIDLECCPEIASILASITTLKDKLPQGSPSSPSIANLVLLKLINRTRKLCDKYDFKMSVYSDDITISGKKHLQKFILLFKKIIVQCGFDVKDEKIFYISNDQEQVITGYRVDRGKIEIPEEKMENYRKDIENLDLSDDGSIVKQLNSILGKIAHTSRANYKQGKELNKLLGRRLRGNRI